ncbi:hypothetical protein DPMN_010912 [Dreissena polymorpha]|uniref:Uncharacterized protein n=1 Tax=Dreissena polymorpha TaxID=45954 RepID=A0A9D4N403_DREPO|nr:hypothetical protein DPMN_010912 [Dreissena polymorpha]
MASSLFTRFVPTLPNVKLNLDIVQTNILLLSNFDKECLRNVSARVFTNQMLMDGHRTKTDPKTSPEQSGELKNMTSTVFTRKTAPPTWRPLFTRKAAPPTGSHVFQRTRTTFKLNQHIIETNILTKHDPLLSKFHEDRTRNCLRTNVDGRTDNGQRPTQKLT